MHNSVPRSSGRRSRRLLVLLMAVVLAVLGGGLPSAAGQPASSAAGAPDTVTTGGRQAEAGTYQVTLLTGDVVTLHVADDGRQAARLEDARTAKRPRPRIFERDGQVHVIPAEAAPYLKSGVLDERLFNVTYLFEQGYHDQAQDDLPLVLVAPDGPATKQQQPAPKGTRKQRELESIGAISVAAGKSGMRSVWRELRGQRAARPDDANAKLAGAGKVWLNGRVEAVLDESVPQIGAPEAWEAGYDGSGVKLAVLDSGYDPTHPDLAGRVVEAKNFTDEEDPADAAAVDRNGHGTHVAATAAGSGAASGGANKGVAPGADLMIGKVLDGTGGGTVDWIIDGMEWAAGQGADVINMSLGTPWPSDGTDPLSQAVDSLTKSSGALFVVAAGNSGPAKHTIGSPGAATHALTVGAVDKSDEAAWFSSRGPRIGDGAIKPEIVAPGVGIVAARARGTSLGNLLDEHYTSLNGTSMASPHVAGAAAILAQQRGDWDAKRLKARLVSSSVPLDGERISMQGAGRVDLPAATAETPTVSTGTLNLGTAGPGSPALSGKLTYHNPTGRAVTLRLSSDVSRSGAGERDGKPALRFTRSALTVPAGGRASTEVRLSAKGLAGGDYEGLVVARDVRDSSAEIRTATSFHVAGAQHTVTVKGIGRDGKPPLGSVELWNTESWDSEWAFFDDGIATFEVYEGEYTLVAGLDTVVGLDPVSTTVAGEPELTVKRDVSLSYDARDAEPVEIATPKDADMETFDLSWRRTVGGGSVHSLAAWGWFGKELFLLPSAPVRDGSFELFTLWQLAEPLLKLNVAGEPAFRVDPSPRLASFRRPYAGDGTLPIAYAGHGTPEDFAEADVDGKIALVTRDGWDLKPQVAAAAAAGAQLLIVHNDEPGGWRTGVGGADVPTYVVDLATGTRLREALAGDPELAVEVVGKADATYAYQLMFGEADRIPPGMNHDVADHPMATVKGEYRQDSERMRSAESWFPFSGPSSLGSTTLFRNGPVERTDYVSTEGVEWQRFGRPHEFANTYWTQTAIERYEAGKTYHQQWWGPLTRPSIPQVSGREQIGMPVARFRDTIRVSIPHYRFGSGTLYGSDIWHIMGDTSEMTLRCDGKTVGTVGWSEGQFTVPPEESDCELALAVTNGADNWMDTSVATDTTWRFRTKRTGDARTVLPLVQANYEVRTGLHNEVATGESYPLTVIPEYQPEATGPGEFIGTVEVSFDDGESWTSLEVERVDGKLKATVPAAAEAGFATVRVVVTDADGNSMSQRIDRAWRIVAAE